MLQTLRIRDYALIDDVEVEFRAGFNVMTGETGAGKSIVVGALNLVLGARASNDVVRDGCKQAKVDAVFYFSSPGARLKSLLAEHDLELEDNELLLSRVVSAQGRSRAYAAGSLVPLSVLAAIGDELVDLHGQHEHQSLLSPARQMELLDGYAKVEKLAAEVAALVAELRAVKKRITALESDDRDRVRRVDFLKYEVAEIDQAGLVSGEDGELKHQRSTITNAEAIFTLARNARSALYESEDGQSALDRAATAAKDLEELAALDEHFAPLLQQLRDVEAQLAGLGDDLRGYTDQVEYDPAELDRINIRLSLISDLQRKYGDSIDAILTYRADAATELSGLENHSELLAELQAERDRLMREGEGVAQALSEKRRSTSRKLSKQISAVLGELGMKGAVFDTTFETIELSSKGIDHIEFQLSANKGAKARRLRAVASGGEISRVMLALKAVFAPVDAVPTLIFDEIDAGIGGAVASQIAVKMKALSTSHQTIAITHLAQIAAAAGTHFHVSKSSAGKKTKTVLERVQNDSRVDELARLLDGSVSEVSVQHARALLEVKE